MNARPESACAAAGQAIVDLLYAHYCREADDARFVASNNLAVPRDQFLAVGGFDEGFAVSEDREFCDRWRRGGRRLVYAPGAIVAHDHRLRLADFCRQHFEYGRGAHRFHRARAGTTFASVRSELGFHRSLPSHARNVLAACGPARTAAVGALLAVWQTANAIGFAWEAAAQASGRPPRRRVY